MLSGWQEQGQGESVWNNLRIPDTVKLVPGWFNETLPTFMEHHKGERVALIHIDSSLYSSAKLVFDVLASYHVGHGTVVVFNEYTYCR